MPFLNKTLTAAGALLWSIATTAVATSSATSMVWDSASSAASIASDSLKNSSGSSSKATGVAQGDYTIIAVAAAPQRPGVMRMTLQAVADASERGALLLYVPAKVIDQGGLAVGETIAARPRPYGVEFAKGEPRVAFFLVLDDDWFRELNSVAVAP